MRITKRSNIAIRVLMYCAVNNQRLVTKAEVAKRCKTSESHLAQIINHLAQLGFLSTQRGRGGGIMLGMPAGDIVIGRVFRVLEENFPVAECFADGDNTCPLVSACRLRHAIADALEAFYARLDEETLEALVCGNSTLIDMLTPEPCLEIA
ncbi:Rrf2 family transcriptional regulator [Roseovarius aestuarii]|nr:Rrf2 family transcriptional regulator [Roseovarius aestuarii]